MIRTSTIAAVLLGFSAAAHAGPAVNVTPKPNLPAVIPQPNVSLPAVTPLPDTAAGPGGGPHVRYNAGGGPHVRPDSGGNSAIENAGIKDFGTGWAHGNPDVAKTPSSGPVPVPYPQ